MPGLKWGIFLNFQTMKTSLLYGTASALLFLSSAFMFKAAVTWKIDDKKYALKFSAGEAEGVVKGLKGTIKFDEADLASSSFNVTADVTTINTGNGMMNKHAKGKEWLDADTYPTIGFTSSSFEKTDKGYTVKGRLKLKGVTKEISIPFTFIKNAFKGSFKIKRKDYNITKDGVNEEVSIDLLVPVKK